MREQPTAAPGSGSAACRVLLFALGGRSYAMRTDKVEGLAGCGSIRAIPGAPPPVVGMAEWRGSVLTVLDLPQLLGHGPGDAPPCLIRLARPLHRAALFIGSVLRLADMDGGPRPLDDDDPAAAARGFEGSFEHRGELVRLIDPLRLVRGLERRLRERV